MITNLMNCKNVDTIAKDTAGLYKNGIYVFLNEPIDYELNDRFPMYVATVVKKKLDNVFYADEVEKISNYAYAINSNKALGKMFSVTPNVITLSSIQKVDKELRNVQDFLTTQFSLSDTQEKLKDLWKFSPYREEEKAEALAFSNYFYTNFMENYEQLLKEREEDAQQALKLFHKYTTLIKAFVTQLREKIESGELPSNYKTLRLNFIFSMRNIEAYNNFYLHTRLYANKKCTPFVYKQGKGYVFSFIGSLYNQKKAMVYGNRSAMKLNGNSLISTQDLQKHTDSFRALKTLVERSGKEFTPFYIKDKEIQTNACQGAIKYVVRNVKSSYYLVQEEVLPVQQTKNVCPYKVDTGNYQITSWEQFVTLMIQGNKEFNIPNLLSLHKKQEGNKALHDLFYTSTGYSPYYFSLLSLAKEVDNGYKSSHVVDLELRKLFQFVQKNYRYTGEDQYFYAVKAYKRMYECTQQKTNLCKTVSQYKEKQQLMYLLGVLIYRLHSTILYIANSNGLSAKEVNHILNISTFAQAVRYSKKLVNRFSYVLKESKAFYSREEINTLFHLIDNREISNFRLMPFRSTFVNGLAYTEESKEIVQKLLTVDNNKSTLSV